MLQQVDVTACMCRCSTETSFSCGELENTFLFRISAKGAVVSCCSTMFNGGNGAEYTLKALLTAYKLFSLYIFFDHILNGRLREHYN